jgi:hypothetical protein
MIDGKVIWLCEASGHCTPVCGIWKIPNCPSRVCLAGGGTCTFCSCQMSSAWHTAGAQGKPDTGRIHYLGATFFLEPP